MHHYDVIVLGSGGGSKITRPAAKLGFKVTIIEEAELGGTCLNRGCIPSKMLIHPADIVSEVREAERFQLDVNQSVGVDFTNLVNRVSATVDGDSQSIAPMYEREPNITLYRGRGRFVDHKVIEVNGEKITAERIFLAPGARAQTPNIPGLEGTPYLTYKEALRQQTQPKSMIVIGGGYIAVELGYFYAALGTKTTFLVRSIFLRGEDDQVREEFTRVFTEKYDVKMNATPTQVDYDGNEFAVTYKTPEGEYTLKAESLFVATGVVPNSDTLGLENTRIKTNAKGFIQVNDFLETDESGVYALGDIIGRYLFRHSVNFEGEYLMQAVFSNEPRKAIQYPPMPHAVFSNPQIAGVGKTEQALIAEGVDYVVGLNAYKNSAMGMALLSDHGFVKLLFDAKTRQLLGAHIIGREASNMVHMLIAYMVMKGTLDDLLNTIYIHPALPEIVRNAARKARVALLKREGQLA